MRRTSMLFVVVLALVAAACSEATTAGSAGTTTSSSTSTAPTAEPVAPGPVKVEVADTEVGDVLTDGDGQSLYVFLLDDESSIACVDACRSTPSRCRSSGRIRMRCRS